LPSAPNGSGSSETYLPKGWSAYLRPALRPEDTEKETVSLSRRIGRPCLTSDEIPVRDGLRRLAALVAVQGEALPAGKGLTVLTNDSFQPPYDYIPASKMPLLSVNPNNITYGRRWHALSVSLSWKGEGSQFHGTNTQSANSSNMQRVYKMESLHRARCRNVRRSLPKHLPIS
jgi:hypothetical protein